MRYRATLLAAAACWDIRVRVLPSAAVFLLVINILSLLTSRTIYLSAWSPSDAPVSIGCMRPMMTAARAPDDEEAHFCLLAFAVRIRGTLPPLHISLDRVR